MKTTNKRNKKRLIAGLLSFALLFGMFPTAGVLAAKKVSLSANTLTVTMGKSKTLKVKNTKKTVAWKILSGKNCITLAKKSKTSATIRGKAEGTAQVQATVGKTKLTCKVTVKNATNQNQNTPTPSTSNPPSPSDAPSSSSAPSSNDTLPSSSTPPLSDPTYEPAGSKEEDVATLKALIAEMRGRGATVSEDLDSIEYSWENDRLTEIYWYRKNLSGNLDLSGLYALKKLICATNQISSLNLSENVALTYLDCGVPGNVKANQISSLDLSKNVALTDLHCSNIQLTSLNLSKNVALTFLDCAFNQLTSLDVSNNVALTDLQCAANQLTSLDLSKNVALRDLLCSGNQLTNLDLSKNTALRFLSCGSNQFSSLDLSNNVALELLQCDDTVTVIGYNK